jgi:hypothetical protein
MHVLNRPTFWNFKNFIVDDCDGTSFSVHQDALLEPFRGTPMNPNADPTLERLIVAGLMVALVVVALTVA